MKKLIPLLALSFVTTAAFASHLRCGYITAYKQNCSSRTYTITVTVFTNTASPVKFGEDGTLDFGDGSNMLIPAVDNIARPDLGPNVGMASFTINHTYAATGHYLISYAEQARNGGVLNMSDSFLTTFYTETLIDTDFCTTPKFIAPPVATGFSLHDFNLSLGASSTDDVQLTYELVTPSRDRGTPVDGFIMPSGLTLNYLTGLLNWDMNVSDFHSSGEYNFALVVKQWSQEGETWHYNQHVQIDFQVILSGDTPEDFIMFDNQLDEYNRVAAPMDVEKIVKVFYEIDGTLPALELFSELPEDAVSFVTYDSVSESTGNNIKVGKVILSPRESDVRENGYLLSIRGNHISNSNYFSDINFLIYTTEELPPLPNPVITGTENEIVDIQIFPNPAKDHVTIHLNAAGHSEVRIYSVQGAAIKKQSFENSIVLDTTDLQPGVYICDVRRNNVSVKKVKIIKSQ